MKSEYDLQQVDKSKLVLDPTIGAPLLYSPAMTVEQMLMRYLGGNKVGVYPDKLVYIRYENIHMDINASDAITLPSPVNISPNQVIAYNDAGWSFSGSKSTITKTVAYTFNFVNGEQVDSIVFNSLLYNITNLTSNYPVSGTGNTLTIEFPTLTKGGVPFSTQIEITSGAFNTTRTVPLTDYTLGLTSNQFNVKYTLSLNGSLPTSGSLTIAHNFGSLSSTLDYRSIHGYIGSRILFSTTQTIPISLFDNAENMTFEDPKVTMSISNSFGMPMSIGITNLSVLSSGGLTIPVNITGNGGQDSILILNYPASVTDAPAVTSRTFDKNNSDIKNAMNAQPKRFTYRITAKANPAGKPSGPIRHFVKRDSKAEINLDVIFPLWGSCLKYGVRDTFEFDYGGLEGNAKGIEFRVWVKNGLPAGGKLTLILLDANKNEVDRIASDMTILSPAPYDNNGIATGITPHDFTLQYYHLEKLPQIKWAAIDIGFHSPYVNGTDASGGVKTVKILSDNTMEIKVGVKVKFAYKIGGEGN